MILACFLPKISDSRVLTLIRARAVLMALASFSAAYRRELLLYAPQSDNAAAGDQAEHADEEDDESVLAEGVQIKAKWKGKKYYPGTIAKVNSNGTYNISYDDGDKEKNVKMKFIRLPDGGAPRASPPAASCRV